MEKNVSNVNSRWFFRLILCSILSVCSHVYAGDIVGKITNSDAGADGECPAGPGNESPGGPVPPKANAHRGNPINIASGNKYHEELVYRGKGEFPLEYKLYYNSYVRTGSVITGRWTVSYSQRISFNLPKFNDGDSVTLTLFREDGQVVYFKGTKSEFLENSETINPYDGAGSLVFKEGNDSDLTLVRFKYFRHDGYTEFFNIQGGLIKIQSPVGAAHVITRDVRRNSWIQCDARSSNSVAVRRKSSGSSGGGAISVIDPGPCGINGIATPRSSYSESVKVVDEYGNEISWSRSGNDVAEGAFSLCDGCSSSVTLPGDRTVKISIQNEMINTITSPLKNNAKKTFIYKQKDSTCGNVWACNTALTGIIDEEGVRYATWGYAQAKGGEPRAIYSFHGENDEMEDRYDIDYVDGHNRVVSNQFGRKQTLNFNVRHDSVRLDSVVSNGGTNCKDGSMSYKYYPDGSIETINGPGEKTLDYTYDNGKIKTIIENKGTKNEKKSEYIWDQEFSNRIYLVHQYQQGSQYRTVAYGYHDNGRVKRKVEIDVTQYELPYPKPSSIRATIFSYDYWDDEETKLKSMTIDGPRSDVDDKIVYRYDEEGNIQAVFNGLYSTEFSNHNIDGYPKTVITPNGKQYSIRYHPSGWVEEVNSGGNNVLYEAEYYENGLLKSRRVQGGDRYEYEYTSAYKIKTIRDSVGNVVSYDRELDASNPEVRNILTTVRSALTNEVVFKNKKQLDSMGRLYKQYLDPDREVNTEFNYDELNNITDITDGRGAHIHIDRSGSGQADVHTGAEGERTAYKYIGLLDGVNVHRYEIEDGEGNTHVFDYNGFGDLIHSQNSTFGEDVWYQYDGAGNLIWKRDGRGVVSQYEYDEINRLRKVIYPGQPDKNIEYGYDIAWGETENTNPEWIGRLTYIKDSAGLTEYKHHAVVSKGANKQWIVKNHKIGPVVFGGIDVTDESGRLEATTYPNIRTVIYEYDNQGAVSEIRTKYKAGEEKLIYASVSKYPESSSIASLSGNGIFQQNVYKLSGALDRIEVTLKRGALGGDQKKVRSYSFDDSGNINEVLHADPKGRLLDQKQYDYDLSGRLLQMDSDGLTLNFEYDHIGNRTLRETIYDGISLKTIDRYTWFDSTVEGKLSEVSTTRTNLDADGELNLGGQKRTIHTDQSGNIYQEARESTGVLRGIEYFYDATNRLARIELNGEHLVSYLYNGLGQRVRRSTGNGTEHYFYSSEGLLLSVLDGKGKTLRDYIYKGSERIALVDYANHEEGEIFYLHNDHLGTAIMVTNEAKQIVWEGDYSPFGELAGESFDNNRFPGQYRDDITGLYYNYFRDYDPSLGRYLQSDPIGLEGGVNTYTYVLNNPLIYIDPFGLINLDIPGTGKKGTSVHANPGPDVTDFRPEHDPPHVHLGANDGPRISTDTFEPLSDDDARKLTKEQKKFCKNLSAEQKQLIRSRQQNVFRFGRSILQGLSGPTAFSPYAYCQADVGRCIDTIESIQEGF